MNDAREDTAEHLAARSSRLPKDIEPPVDLWPGIESRISDERSRLEWLAGQLEQDVEPGVDLWPGIRAELGNPRRALQPQYRPGLGPWLNAAASVGSIALIGLLAFFAFDTSAPPPDASAMQVGRPAAPGSGERWWMTRMSEALERMDAEETASLRDAVDSLRKELEGVRDERKAIEQSLDRDVQSLVLRELWLHVYQTELSLESKAEQMIEAYRRG